MQGSVGFGTDGNPTAPYGNDNDTIINQTLNDLGLDDPLIGDWSLTRVESDLLTLSPFTSAVLLSVPEPSCLQLVGVAAFLGLVARRRRLHT